MNKGNKCTFCTMRTLKGMTGGIAQRLFASSARYFSANGRLCPIPILVMNRRGSYSSLIIMSGRSCPQAWIVRGHASGHGTPKSFCSDSRKHLLLLCEACGLALAAAAVSLPSWQCPSKFSNTPHEVAPNGRNTGRGLRKLPLYASTPSHCNEECQGDPGAGRLAHLCQEP